MDCLIVYVFTPVSLADFGQKIAKSEPLLDHAFGHPEGGGDLGGPAAFFDETNEGFMFGHRISIAPGGVFDERGFHRRRIIAGRHDGTGQRRKTPLLGGNGPPAPIPPAARDDFDSVLALVGIGPDQKRLQNALGADGRQDIGYVRRTPVMAHVEFGIVNVLDGDMTQLHWFTFSR